ncbi:cytochrome P450 [Haloplanus halobius]|uniref:cytochrome P450 n=1 Tax=Haloplanus halobius TaxID=2934938 RepID=UPI00200E4AC0|nr:cytochrome P450 [Haloplanus sp. XH21]
MSEDTRTGVGGSHEPAATPPLPPYPSTVGHPLLHTVGSMRDVFGFRTRAMAERDLVRIKLLGPGDVYHLGHPDYFERVLLNDRDRFCKSEDFRIAFEGGLVAVEGETWQRQRDVLQPLFTRDSLVDYADGMAAQIRRRRDHWEPGTRIDLTAETSQLSLDVLFATLFGHELELGGDEAIRTAADRLQHWFAPTSYPLPQWVPTPARWRFKRGKRRLQRVATRLLEAKADDPPADPAAADDLLSLLVGLRESGAAEGEALSDDRLRDQVVTMIFAGHDTTSTAIAFAFYALATTPDVRDRFHTEVDTLSGPPTVDDLESLPVTRRIVTEALRKYPPVYTIPREAATDVTIDGSRVPEGAPVWLTVDQVHHDERFYDAPDEFRPERWDGDLRERLPDFAYAPFGGGPRRCIGRQFALMEAQLALAIIGREYDLVLDDPPAEPPMIAGMTARMAPDTEFRVVER